MSWCLQCGSSGTPERAVGWDEDGEPACGMHRLKAERPLILAPAIESPPMIAEPIQKPAAAPSPVQTSAAKESTMMSGPQPKVKCPNCSRIIASHQMPNHLRTCGVVKERKRKADRRTCSCGCGAALRSRWAYVKGHNKVEGGATVAAPKKPRKNIEKNSDGSFTVRVHELAHEPLPLGGKQQSTDLEVALRFTGEKLDKIWGLLSLEQKAVAIDAIINSL